MLQNLSSAAVVIGALKVNLISLPTAQEQSDSLAAKEQCHGINDRHKLTKKLLKGLLNPKTRI